MESLFFTYFLTLCSAKCTSTVSFTTVHSQVAHTISHGCLRPSSNKSMPFSCRSDEGFLKWSDGTQVDYTNWVTDQPVQDSVADCMQMYKYGGVYGSNGHGKWKLQDCDRFSLSYVCERAASKPKPHGLLLLQYFCTRLNFVYFVLLAESTAAAWCNEIGSLTSLDVCNSRASSDHRDPISLGGTKFHSI